jgi:hypothetical protein
VPFSMRIFVTCAQASTAETHNKLAILILMANPFKEKSSEDFCGNQPCMSNKLLDI